MPTETLFLDAKKALDVILLMVEKGQMSWANLPPTEKTRMLSILRKCLEAANRGHALAQFTLGCLYYNEQGCKQNLKEVVKLHRQAANQGHVDAQFSLGLMYDIGKDGKQDFKEAAKWYRQAAVQGQAEAQFYLGEMYYIGRGVT
jgi:TPR repeat protein